MKKIILFCFFLGLFMIILGTFFFQEKEHVRQFMYKTIFGDHSIPEPYLLIYQEAAEEYDIPWQLLASIHRVETIFSTMDPLVSPVGAVGHFQFMPRTWVGWSHPGSPQGVIEENVDITNLSLIQEHNGYGIDASGNGIADPFDLEDSAYAAAKYLADHGAVNGEIEKALLAYNKSQDYVNEVLYFYEAYLEHYELIDIPF